MKVITVCGSYKYKNEMQEITEKMALKGNCMLTPIELTKHNKEAYTKEECLTLGKMHKDKIKLSDDKKSLIGLKEITDNYKKQAPHFFEKKKANGYEPVNPEGDKGDDDGEISMAANFAKEANKSESQNTKSQFFN